MKILITGSYGFIGTNLVNFLLNKNYKIYGFDNFSNNEIHIYKKRIKFIKKNKNYKNYFFYKKDLTQEIPKNIIKKIDLIIHLAAQPGVQYSKINKKIYFEKNLIALTNILDFAIKKKAKFIFASSSSVYGNSKMQSENSKLNPISIYGLTKKFGEDIVKHYCEVYNLKSISIRFFTVYGPFGRPDMSYTILLKNILKNSTITLYNYGKNKRSFTYVDDLSECIYQICQMKKDVFKINNNILNIGNPKNYSLNELIKIFKNLTNKKKILINFQGKLSQDPELTKANLNKSKYFIKKDNFINLKSGIKKFYDWYIN